MKKELKKLNLKKEVITNLGLDQISGGGSQFLESRLSDTCLCMSEPDNC